MIRGIFSIVYMFLMRTTENISKKKKKIRTFILRRPRIFDAEENGLMRVIFFDPGKNPQIRKKMRPLRTTEVGRVPQSEEISILRSWIVRNLWEFEKVLEIEELIQIANRFQNRQRKIYKILLFMKYSKQKTDCSFSWEILAFLACSNKPLEFKNLGKQKIRLSFLKNLFQVSKFRIEEDYTFSQIVVLFGHIGPPLDIVSTTIHHPIIFMAYKMLRNFPLSEKVCSLRGPNFIDRSVRREKW